LKQNIQEISHSPLRTLITHKITQTRFLEGNKGRMKFNGRVRRGIYRVGKPMGAAEKVIKSRVWEVHLCTIHLAEYVRWSPGIRSNTIESRFSQKV
jgi:hypothetical protein